MVVVLTVNTTIVKPEWAIGAGAGAGAGEAGAPIGFATR
jgi:hypothetical protein